MVMHIDEAVGLNRLLHVLERAQRVARRDGRAVLASLVEPCPPIDPLALFNAASPAGERALWIQPSQRFALVGVGSARSIDVDEPDRFDAARRVRRDLLDHADVERPGRAPHATGPLLLGGFSFDPSREQTGLWRDFPAARLTLPRILLTKCGDEQFLTLNVLLEPDSDPIELARALTMELEALLTPASSGVPPDMDAGRVTVSQAREGADWRRVVAEASAAIRRGEAEKIVLAREVRLQGDCPFNVAQALDRLVSSYPTCYVFAFGAGERTFLGATPERLVRLEDGELKAACLAGSERRGSTPEEDRALGEALLNSEKDREEHAIVVRALRQGLDGLCDRLIMPDEPELLSVSNVHHLYTPIMARVRDGICILDAVERLHPTPAVGGYPRETALKFIRDHERMDRGWYAAPIGWVGPDGGGEFAVALRSALVDGPRASLFAGCGIMGDSDPSREYEESALKLRPMLSALGGEQS